VDELLTWEEQDEDVEAQTSSWALTPSQRSKAARTLADVMVRLQRPGEAVTYFQIARKSEKSAAIRKQIDSKINDLRAQLRRQQLNASRRPVLHDALEQDRVVRPRLLARTVPSAAKGVAR
jgi:hypothetical protein